MVLFADGPLVERLRHVGDLVEVLPLAADVATVDRHTAGGSARDAVLNGIRVLPFVLRLGRRLRVLDVEVIYTTSLKSDLIGVLAAWLARRPLVWHVHDRISADYLPERMVRFVRLADRHAPRQVIANSRAAAATLPAVRQLSVGIIGGTLFGEQAYEARVRAEAEELGIGDRIDFTGFVTDPTRELDSLSVFVHTSPTDGAVRSGHPRGHGLAGCPSSQRGGGGVIGILEPQDGGPALGRLVAPDDVAAFAVAIIETLEDPRSQDRARAAWLVAGERFPIEATAAAITEVWRTVGRAVSRRRRGR